MLGGAGEVSSASTCPQLSGRLDVPSGVAGGNWNVIFNQADARVLRHLLLPITSIIYSIRRAVKAEARHKVQQKFSPLFPLELIEKLVLTAKNRQRAHCARRERERHVHKGEGDSLFNLKMKKAKRNKWNFPLIFRDKLHLKFRVIEN